MPALSSEGEIASDILRCSRDARAGSHQMLPSINALGADSGFSFTKLLGLDSEEGGTPGGLQPIPSSSLPAQTEPPQPPWRRMVAPPGVKPQPAAPDKARRTIKK